MRLNRFKAEGVHGYLSFDVKFLKDLTFLTGINGSGKTTAINAIVSLITPDLSTLSNLRYESLSVELSHENENFTITSIGDDEHFEISASGIDERMKLRRYILDADLSAARQVEHETEYFRDLTNTNAVHPVMRLIARLPTPMFLGLDRRARFEPDDRRRMYSPWRSARTGKNVFSTSLARSLSDAAELAATSNRDALISSARIGDDLRRDMLLNLLTVAPEDYGNLSVPTES
jgi:energy-coupling factor transporter ATP-binding protein EcfA2